MGAISLAGKREHPRAPATARASRNDADVPMGPGVPALSSITSVTSVTSVASNELATGLSSLPILVGTSAFPAAAARPVPRPATVASSIYYFT